MTLKEKIKFRAEKLIKIIKQSDKPFRIIITQVDPDAIGAAVGLNRIMFEHGVESKIIYCGSVSHDQNVALFKRYDLNKNFTHVDDFDEKESEYNYALVDSSSTTDNRLDKLKGIKPIIVIDHHRGSNIEETEKNFVWIEDVGSACTLVFEIINELKAPMNGEWKYTCLAIGIYTDTKSLISAGKRDRSAFDKLTKDYDQNDFINIINHRKSRLLLQNKTNAYNNISENGPRIVTNMGLIDPKRGDDLSTVADELIQFEGVTLVIVWAMIDKHTIRVSARSSADATFDLNQLIKEKLSPFGGAKITPDGHGEGGARLDFNVKEWLKSEDTLDPLNSIQKKIEASIFE